MFRGLFIISFKAQVGVFLFKLLIMKREHSDKSISNFLACALKDIMKRPLKKNTEAWPRACWRGRTDR